MAGNMDQGERRHKRLEQLARLVAESDETVNAAYDVSESRAIDSPSVTPSSAQTNEATSPPRTALPSSMARPSDNVANAWGSVEPYPPMMESNESPKSLFSNPSWAELTNPSSQAKAQEKPRPDYRQRRIDRVSDLLKKRYRRITNEANSALLVDTYTGDVLPEILDAIAAAIATEYREVYQAEVSKGDIKRAFEHLGELIVPWDARVFFGRAGFHPECRERYIDAGPGECFVFPHGASHYQPLVGQPCIRPRQSRPLAIPAGWGNIRPQSIEPLFDHTVLPEDVDLLIIAWMMLCWMPDRKQVMLELLGMPSLSLEQSHTLVKNVVDPATVALLNELPSNVKQLNDMALKHYLLSFHQVDALTPTQQNHLFSLMRGKEIPWQWKGKKVEATIAVQCPVILNSLESVATTPKLADATLSVEVMACDPSRGSMSVPSATSLTMGLLSIFGQVNRGWEAVSYDPRFDRYGDLADLCRVGELVADSLGRDPSAFWEQFDRNQQGRRSFELEETPVAQAVAHALDDASGGVMELPVKQWLAHLQSYRPDGTRPEQWPTSSRGLGAAFKRITPLLRDFGIILTSTGQRGPLCYWRAEKSALSSNREGAANPAQA